MADAAVYEISDLDTGQVVYVGMSVNGAAERVPRHRDKRWFPDHPLVSETWMPAHAAAAFEAARIAELRPIGNRQGNPDVISAGGLTGRTLRMPDEVWARIEQDARELGRSVSWVLRQRLQESYGMESQMAEQPKVTKTPTPAETPTPKDGAAGSKGTMSEKEEPKGRAR